MAYSDYGGYAYRNRKRVTERSDWRLGEDGTNVGAPEAQPGFASAIGKGMSSEEYERQVQGPRGHAVLGSGPIYVSLCEDYYVLVHHGRERLLYWSCSFRGPRNSGELQATTMRLGGDGEPTLRIIVEDHPETRARVLYAELEEHRLEPKQETVIWTGWSSILGGAGGNGHDGTRNPQSVGHTGACDARMRALLWDWKEPEEETVRWSEQCASCDGTGLISGRHEGVGIAVVCRDCRGRGRRDRAETYTPFAIRFPKREIERVFQCNPGIPLTGETSGGVDREEWENDRDSTKRPGAEPRRHVCPAWWYLWADHERQPRWDECESVEKFVQCPLFSEKGKCWERFDRENGNDEPAAGSGREPDAETESRAGQ